MLVIFVSIRARGPPATGAGALTRRGGRTREHTDAAPSRPRAARRIRAPAAPRLRRTYGAITARRRSTLDIPDGEFFALIGPSGCGKTTTLRILAGLERADEGGGVAPRTKDVTFVPPHRRPVSTVFQNYALFPHLSVFENVAFGLRERKLPKAQTGAGRGDARARGPHGAQREAARSCKRRAAAAGSAGALARARTEGAAARRAAGRARPEAEATRCSALAEADPAPSSGSRSST